MTDNNTSYQLVWSGKEDAIAETDKPTEKRFVENLAKSFNGSASNNIYIEGDNLDALKLMQNDYSGKIKLIYVDPPYNVRNRSSSIYSNNFSKKKNKRYTLRENEIGYTAARLAANRSNSDVDHSEWLNMILPRIILARNLLRDDGFLVFAIDDNEIHDAIIVLNEVFGEECRVGTIVVRHNPTGRSEKSGLLVKHEYALVYAKSAKNIKLNTLQSPNEDTSQRKSYFNEVDEKGEYCWRLLRTVYNTNIEYMAYPIYIDTVNYKIRLPKLRWDPGAKKYETDDFPSETETVLYPVDKRGVMQCWHYGAATMAEKLKNNRSEFRVLQDKNGKYKIYYKVYKKTEGFNPSSIWSGIRYSATSGGALLLADLFGKKVFDYPKSLYTMSDILTATGVKFDDIVLDIFSGSATTAHAVMLKNLKDNANIRFILIQVPEKVSEEYAFKADFGTICDIGEERIRRSAKKISEENPNAEFDGGFRVFTISS